MTRVRAEAVAFAPGHVTGFFQIVDDAPDPAQIGSRGAGFSLNLGVASRVRVEDAGVPGVTVTLDGRAHEAATTRRAVELLAGAQDVQVSIDQSMGLPVSQGFGMSAAGALSASLALAEVLGRTRREAVWAAHCAEVLQRTGLGDVVGAAAGGFETRVRPGCEPYGLVRSWRPDAHLGPFWVAVVDEAIETKRVLTDPRRRAEINRIGGDLVAGFVEHPSLSDFVERSRRFAAEARLATPRVLEALDALGPGARAGQCMLGGSLFVFGGDPQVRARLARFGAVTPVGIDWAGARVTQPRRVLA